MTETKAGTDLAKQVLAKGLASRRGVMCGLAGLGAAGALAACGTAESPNTESPDTSTTSAADGGTTGETGGGTGIAATADVPVGGGIVVDETVIVQPTADEFLAFSAVCPHQGAIVDAPDADGNIICPRHQSTWTLEGTLEQGPAETNLSAVEITVEDGQIALA
ncbi:Rieske (2Fe-2S) protein [Glycomyces niveus]|uniref:Cytochrome bc1 complex Rieske iron-sulfur subunit n=1 Tax=Glycomyces niveus TaxID=2820287 RepID=A0ABS3U9B3_9ACTN|nr:Rieske (2Fe-2S) protein [Glycomyces sp. NEAU-S30]MBO3735358.1 Rieske (2Fe-2S) protein [Glycomyces sp. NEAU-S30]